jgi:hypothetical protein
MMRYITLHPGDCSLRTQAGLSFRETMPKLDRILGSIVAQSQGVNPAVLGLWNMLMARVLFSSGGLPPKN